MRWNSEYPVAYNRQEFWDDEILYAQHLAHAGYDNHYFGKWNCGVDKTAADYRLKGWSLPKYGNLYACDAEMTTCRGSAKITQNAKFNTIFCSANLVGPRC